MARPIHDWQDKKAYPKARSLSANGWAWEFLRRNPSYQDDFEKMEALVSKHIAVHDLNGLLHYEPPMHEGENMEAWALRAGPGSSARLISVVIGKRWGTLVSGARLPNPFKGKRSTPPHC